MDIDPAAAGREQAVTLIIAILLADLAAREDKSHSILDFIRSTSDAFSGSFADTLRAEGTSDAWIDEFSETLRSRIENIIATSEKILARIEVVRQG